MVWAAATMPSTHCERHLKSLLFAPLAGLTSFRQSVTGLVAHRRWFYHLNLRAPRRSTLADANAERPAAVFRDIAMALIPIAAGALRPRERGADPTAQCHVDPAQGLPLA